MPILPLAPASEVWRHTTGEEAADALLADGQLREVEGELVVTDPLLADGVRQRLPV